MLKKVVYLSMSLLAGSVVFGAEAAPDIKVINQNTDAVIGAIRLFDSGNRDEAYILLKTVESSGDLRILARLGMCYYGGQGVKADLKKAYEYFRKAEASPDGWGLYGMGICYHEGIEVAKDLQKAKEYFRSSLKKGVIYANGSLGFIALQENKPAEAKNYFLQEYNCETLPNYWRGLSAGMLGQLSDNVQDKIAYWEKAALWAGPIYCLHLTELYNSGKAMEVNPEKALEWAELYAAGTNDKSIYASVAFEIAIEKMFLQDNDAAKKYMLIAADNGDDRALWYAYCFTDENKYVLAAAEKGDIRAYNHAGALLFNNPQATAEDKDKAFKYYQAASKLETNEAWHATCNMAAFYAADPTNNANMQKAFELYKSVADWYSPRGLRGVGISYWLKAHNTNDIKQKEKYSLLALENTAAAAGASDEHAGNLLGDMIEKSKQYAHTPQYKFAVGVNMIVQGSKENRQPEFFSNPVKLIKEAADQGNEHALTALGIFAQQGINLKRDLNAAAGYFRKASCKGNLYAKQQLISGDFNEFVSEKEYDDLQLELIKRGDRASCHVRAMLQEVKGNTAEAIRLFRKNAAADFTPSAVELYRILSDSKDEKSLKEAADHLFKAISLNNGQAQCMLGASCLQNPETTPRFGVITMMKGLIDGADYPESVLRHLAYLYANGFGVKKSPENARKICESMIGQGYAAGYLTMGEMYQQGVFGKADLKQATEYYQKGAAQGDEACQKALKKLSQNK